MEEQQDTAKQQQALSQRGDLSPAVPLPMTPSEKAKYAAIAGVPSLLLLEMLHAGGAGLAIAGLLGYGAWHFSDQIREILPERKEGDQKQSSSFAQSVQNALYWLGNGHMPASNQGEEEGTEAEAATVEGEAQPLEEGQMSQPGKVQKVGKSEVWIPGQFRLDEAVSRIRDFNKRGYIYFGESEEGAVVVRLNQMYHVMDVSSSGKGKSNRFRLAMMQMVNTCSVYYINPLAAPVKGVTDSREIEVWQPIYDRLANKHPVKTGAEIKQLLTSLVNLLETRNEQEEHRDFSWMKKPIFLFIDEQPEVFKRCPEAAELLDQIGRMGRQYFIFFWLATQTARVEDIGLSTATQAQVKTRLYGGADNTSGNRAMKGGLTKDQERILQSNEAGLMYVLGDGLTDLTLTRSPLVTNEAMFEYLGLGPFKKEDWKNPISRSGDKGISRGISESSPEVYPPEESEDIPGDTDGEPLDIANSENEIVLSQAQKMKLLRVLDMDLEGTSQNKIVQELWGKEPNSREGRAATDELRQIRAYIAQEQRKRLGL